MTAYEFPAVKDGRWCASPARRQTFRDAGFLLNLRRSKFADARVRHRMT
jgi:hypothetical protein